MGHSEREEQETLHKTHKMKKKKETRTEPGKTTSYINRQFFSEFHGILGYLKIVMCTIHYVKSIIDIGHVYILT